jgi:hypothetical protein
MLMIRFITAAAVVVMAVGAAGAAAAQTAAGDTAGKPVSLLQVLGQPATATTPAKPHTKYATRHTRRWAKKSHERPTDTAAEPDQPATDAANASPANAPAASAWANDAAPLPGVANDATAPTVIPAIDQNLSELVVGGRTVQIATPDEANAIDLAADHQMTATPVADAQATAAPAVALAQPDDPQRDTWYEELLATLGGALAAGLVAWFFILGGGPQQRMYG